MLSLLLILTAAFAILTWKNLHAGLLLLVAVLPSYLLRTDVFGIPTTLLELLVVTFLIIWLMKRKKLPIRIGRDWKALFPTFLLLITATISILVAPETVTALGIWKAYFVEPILLFFVVRHELTKTDSMDANRSPDRVTSLHLFQALGVSAVILSVVAIIQWLTGAGLPIPWDIERRVTSVFDYPNALGLFLGPILIIGVLFLCRSGGWRGAWLWSASADERQRVEHRQSLHRDRTRREFIFWFIIVFLSSIAIILAQSEAAVVSVITTLLIAGFLHRKTRVISSSLVVLSILVTLLFPPLFQKLTLQDYSGSVRLSQWNETIDLLQDHWLLGAGLSGYPTIFEPYHQATHLEIFQYPHNIVLNIWVELGLLGLVAVGWLGYKILSSLRAVRGSEEPSGSRRGGQRPTKQSLSRWIASLPLVARNDVVIATLALLQMSIHGLVDVPYFKNDLAILTWILLAIVFAYARPTTPATTSQ